MTRNATGSVRAHRRRGARLVATLGAMLALAAAPGATARALRSPVALARRAAEARQDEARRAVPLRGVVLGLFSDHEGDSYRRDLAEIRALGAGHVLIIVQHAVASVRDTEIGPRPWLTPSRPRLDAALAEARRLGLGIVLMPTLYVEDTEDGAWRGTLAPESWDAWWESYESFILEHARLAARHGVEVFCIGSELCSTERQRTRWAELALAVRRATPSLLTYSFNWDHLSPGLADLVDLAGMNAYHDLGDGPDTSVPEMKRRWREIRRSVDAWASRSRRLVLVTEVGFRSVRGAEVSPWDYLVQKEYDGAAQGRCYEAFVESWEGTPLFAGAFFYAWRGAGGPGDTTYTPRAKPAETVLRSWLAGGPRQEQGAHERHDSPPAAPAAAPD